MPVKNINSLQYFIEKWDIVDPEYEYAVPYNSSVDTDFKSLPTFVAEFHNCKVHSCPLLITMANKMITQHVWPLTHQSRMKPKKTHGLLSLIHI